MEDILNFFLKVLLKWWWLLSSAVFTILAIYEFYKGKSNSWNFKASLILAGICLLLACFFAGLDEFKKAKSLESLLPVIRVEPLEFSWLPEKQPSGKTSVELYVQTRLTNVGNSDTTIQGYNLMAKDNVGGVYPCVFEADTSRPGPSLNKIVSRDSPLKRGVHAEGWLHFGFIPLQDNPNHLVDSLQRVSLMCELIVTDAFGQEHSSGESPVVARLRK